MTDLASQPDIAVLVVDDEPSSVNLLRITLGMDYTVYTATDGEAALALLADHPDIGVAIIDQRMPSMSGTELIQRTIEPYPDLVRIILTGYTDIDSLIQAINAGRVYRYLTKPWKKPDLLVTVRRAVDAYHLAAENRRLHAELKEANDKLQRENIELRREVKGRYKFDEIIGSSDSLQKTLRLVDRIVSSDSNVLVYGETGTGKELIARAIHYNGPRAEHPLVSLNCADFTGDMLSSELFGHKKGSFTGALEDRPGMFRAADGGSIFLDEIGECPEAVQSRLLRVLDAGEIRRVGDDKPTKVDVRIIAATNRNLDVEVQAGRFRKDLYFRLNVVSVELPPLRNRHGDVPILAAHFLNRLNDKKKKRVAKIEDAAMHAMSTHDYPGNVRELENIIERAHVLADNDGSITADLLPDALQKGATSTTAAHHDEHDLRGTVEAFEANVIRQALQRNDNNQTHTAQQLGVSRRALIDKLRKYDIR